MKTLLKKKSVRILSLLLVAALILPLALPASAVSNSGSHTWTVGSKRYTANVTSTTETQIHIPSDMRPVYHKQGSETRMTAITNCTATATVQWHGTMDGNMLTGLEKALTSAGSVYWYSPTINAGTSVTIPANAPSGNYVIGIVLYAQSGSWKVTSVEEDIKTVEGLGTFTNAPTPKYGVQYTFVQVG